jgi:hypothetical protein
VKGKTLAVLAGRRGVATNLAGRGVHWRKTKGIRRCSLTHKQREEEEVSMARGRSGGHTEKEKVVVDSQLHTRKGRLEENCKVLRRLQTHFKGVL